MLFYSYKLLGYFAQDKDNKSCYQIGFNWHPSGLFW